MLAYLRPSSTFAAFHSILSSIHLQPWMRKAPRHRSSFPTNAHLPVLVSWWIEPERATLPAALRLWFLVAVDQVLSGLHPCISDSPSPILSIFLQRDIRFRCGRTPVQRARRFAFPIIISPTTRKRLENSVSTTVVGCLIDRRAIHKSAQSCPTGYWSSGPISFCQEVSEFRISVA